MALSHPHTVDQVRQHVDYNPATGIFTWKTPKQKRVVGGLAGTVYSHGYRVIRIDGHAYMASHIAVALMTGYWPAATVDHRDRNPSNDAWDNLRVATASEQIVNQKVRANSKSGVKGVSQHHNKFRARVKVGGAFEHLGLFDTKEEAANAVQARRAELYGSFAEENA